MFIRRLLTVAVLGLAALVTPVATSTASAVNAFEWDFAVDSSALGYELCTSVSGTHPGGGISACFHPDGDKFWVSDDEADGLSASMYWWNYNSDGSLYRHGACVEKSGAGHHGWCNKNFREGSDVKFQLCYLDFPTKAKGRCSGVLGPFTS